MILVPCWYSTRTTLSPPQVLIQPCSTITGPQPARYAVVGSPHIWQWGPFSRYLMGIWGSLLLGFPHKLKGTRTTYPSEV